MRTLSDPKIGDIVRYGGGSTALAKLTGRHAGGWHGDQCMGGGTFISEPFYEPDCEDLAIWNDQQRQQDMRYGPKRSQLSFKELRKISEQRCNEAFFPLESKDGPWWGNAMAGECGEACNVVKKIDRDGLTDKRVAALAKSWPTSSHMPTFWPLDSVSILAWPSQPNSTRYQCASAATCAWTKGYRGNDQR